MKTLFKNIKTGIIFSRIVGNESADLAKIIPDENGNNAICINRTDSTHKRQVRCFVMADEEVLVSDNYDNYLIDNLD